MYKNILCAIDVTPESDVILTKASELAKQYGAKLSLVHIIEYRVLPQDYQKKLEQDVKPVIDEMSEKYQIKKKNCFIKFGQSYTNICDLAQELSTDLVVLGSHGKHGVQVLLGSTANGVMQKAQCDVLLVKMHG
jgi:universal stress protein A